MSDEMKAGYYEPLLVWRKRIVLVKLVYGITGAFAGDERYGLLSQMRRAAVS